MCSLIKRQNVRQQHIESVQPHSFVLTRPTEQQNNLNRCNLTTRLRAAVRLWRHAHKAAHRPEGKCTERQKCPKADLRNCCPPLDVCSPQAGKPVLKKSQQKHHKILAKDCRSMTQPLSGTKAKNVILFVCLCVSHHK